MRTIAAISTPFGNGGIAVIRISGDEAFCVTDKVFTCQRAKRLFEVSGNTIVYGNMHDLSGQQIDQVLVSVFHAPHSYTGEDVVEISCHGGILVAKKVLKAVIEAGADLAERGEFTKRAFLNGKMDLSQAEGVNDLIHAVSDKGAQAAVFQLEGRLSKEIGQVRETLLKLTAHLNAAADFPEEEIPALAQDAILKTLQNCYETVSRLIQTADYGKIVKDGLPVAVIGKPNVGKSSLLNALAGEDRAIVTEIAGTTRDVIEEYVQLDGIAVKLMDTAGMHETADTVERIGVERSVSAAERAGLILAVFDASQPLSKEDYDVLAFLENKPHFLVLNKSDLGVAQTGVSGICVSAKKGDGLDALISAISSFIENIYEGGAEQTVITNERHYQCLVRCKECLVRTIGAVNDGMPQDLLAIDIGLAVEALGEMIGMTVSDEIVDRIFRDFCLGK